MIKPGNIQEYKKWLTDNHQISNIDLIRQKKRYEAVLGSFEETIRKSNFWRYITDNLTDLDHQYLIENNYDLMENHKVELNKKSWESFLLKTYRKNILDNKNWPMPPEAGWILPKNWYTEINDTLRTIFIVKYLDGAIFLAKKIEDVAHDNEIGIKTSFEAREYGYYAVHLIIAFSVEIPIEHYDTELCTMYFEIQISTQLQDVIRQLTHKIYENDRIREKLPLEKNMGWQWKYDSPEFTPNYLGHILHYVEGVIMEIRNKQKGES
jgi:ppGpp synthetase/RelA/SpoT-type nucleotidyltranferase